MKLAAIKKVTRLALFFLFLGILCGASQTFAQEFMVGADVSSLPSVEDNGGQFFDEGEEGDLLEIMQDHGYNWMRLKIWHTPDEPYNDLERVRLLGQRIKNLDLNFLLDFHYSDTWADPGSQDIPSAWVGIPFEAMVDSMYNYTYVVMTTLRDSGAMPDMVQIGNEINCGMLWPVGNICGGNNTPEQWSQLGQLIGAAIQAVDDSEGENDDVQIMIHHANGHPNFLQGLLDEGLTIDYYARSYYPTWHGTIDELEDNLTTLANQFDQGIVVVETAYLWTTDWADGTNNVFWTDDVVPGYPASVAGQTNLMYAVRAAVQNLPDDQGKGVFYWEPAWITTETRGTPWENACLFDFEGNALSSLDALARDISDWPTSTLTMRINTSSVLDTFRSNDILQIRGEVYGLTGERLIDGRRLSWGDDSRLLPEYAGDEVWEIEIPLYVGDTLSYKFWTGFTLWDPTHQRLGWEGPVTPPVEFDNNTRMVVAGENDTTIALQFVNGSGATVEQYWRPFDVDEDSLTVMYRVNLARDMERGTFNPDAGDFVAVMGSAPLMMNSLHVMQREEFSVADGSFWSLGVKMARAEIEGDLDISFTYVVMHTDGTRETENLTREYTFAENYPEEIASVPWVFFNNGLEVGIGDAGQDKPLTPTLLDAWPNPFNATVRLSYSLDVASNVSLAVYNLLGQEVRLLRTARQTAGQHQVVWDGADYAGQGLPSGIYFVTLTTNAATVNKKVLLLR
ncbi:glycosyl hydrolase 53 family protein [bacterium]|nr:glycosyl hydrolase 53 family protein [bacterium]